MAQTWASKFMYQLSQTLRVLTDFFSTYKLIVAIFTVFQEGVSCTLLFNAPLPNLTLHTGLFVPNCGQYRNFGASNTSPVEVNNSTYIPESPTAISGYRAYQSHILCRFLLFRRPEIHHVQTT